ncbi:MAG: type II secretion protein F [Firmicutes bacterium HGW-Firmicutes-21]|nr:MAG: type II secretion protein F [Firmicutes bacterium HGW-Firmicutes-21]
MNGFVSTVYIIIISILFVVLSFILTIAVSQSMLKDKMTVQKRLTSFFTKEAQKISVNPKGKKNRRGQKEKLKLSQAVLTELQTAGILIRVEEFATIWLIISFVPSGIVALITGNAIVSIILAIVGIMIPPMYIKKQKKKRIAAFENQLGDALVIMCNCLRSGLTLGQAIENISSEMSEPISKEFTRVCTEIKYGTSLEKALNSMSDRIGSYDLMMAVSAINIQRQVGGNLSEILSNISETIKSRIKLKGEIKVLTATGRASGIVIGLLPIGLGLIIFLLNPDYMIAFFENSIGRILLMVGAVMETIGFLMVKKIITIKY